MKFDVDDDDDGWTKRTNEQTQMDSVFVSLITARDEDGKKRASWSSSWIMMNYSIETHKIAAILADRWQREKSFVLKRNNKTHVWARRDHENVPAANIHSYERIDDNSFCCDQEKKSSKERWRRRRTFDLRITARDISFCPISSALTHGQPTRDYNADFFDIFSWTYSRQTDFSFRDGFFFSFHCCKKARIPRVN